MLSEIARRKRAFLEKVQAEAKMEKENLAILEKIKTKQYSPTSMTASNKAKANVQDTSKNEILRRKQAYLDTVQKEEDFERRNQPLVEYLKAKNQRQLFPEAINLYSTSTAVDVVKKNNENSQVDGEKEKELAFTNLKTVMNGAYARNLRDQLQELDDANTYPLKLIILLNSYWSEIREEVVKRFRAGGANPDVVYNFIVGYMENNIINKFASKAPIKADPTIIFKPSVVEEDTTPQPQPVEVDSLNKNFSYPADPVSPADPLSPVDPEAIPESLTMFNKKYITAKIIVDFVRYSMFENDPIGYTNEFDKFEPSKNQTRDNVCRFFYELSQNRNPENVGNMDPNLFEEIQNAIIKLGYQAWMKHKASLRAPTPPLPAPSPPVASSSSASSAAPPTTTTSSSTANSRASSPNLFSSVTSSRASSPLTTGNGLKKNSKKKTTNNKKKKLRYIIKGRGLAKAKKEKEKPFYVDMDGLNRNVLSVKYRTSRKYKINPMVISDGEKHMINQLITYKQFNNQIYSTLSSEEKRRVEMLIHELKMDNELEGYDKFASTKELYDQLQIIRGQIEAGNNNPNLKIMARKIISELYALKRITKTQANQILMELM